MIQIWNDFLDVVGYTILGCLLILCLLNKMKAQKTSTASLPILGGSFADL